MVIIQIVMGGKSVQSVPVSLKVDLVAIVRECAPCARIIVTKGNAPDLGDVFEMSIFAEESLMSMALLDAMAKRIGGYVSSLWKDGEKVKLSTFWFSLGSTKVLG